MSDSTKVHEIICTIFCGGFQVALWYWMAFKNPDLATNAGSCYVGRNSTICEPKNDLGVDMTEYYLEVFKYAFWLSVIHLASSLIGAVLPFIKTCFQYVLLPILYIGWIVYASKIRFSTLGQVVVGQGPYDEKSLYMPTSGFVLQIYLYLIYSVLGISGFCFLMYVIASLC